MPENYLHLSGDVVDALGRTENNQPLQFNEIQCRLLKQKLQETVMPLLSRVDKDSLPPEKQALFEQRCRGAALLELYRIVKRAEAIIHGCSIQDWLTAAIKLANSFETFVDIFFKLDWCKAVVGIVFSNALKSEVQHVGDNIDGFGEAECVLKMDEIRNILQQPASQDRESLRRRLTEMQEDTGARSKQEIVAYLLKLLTTDPANMEETTFHVLSSIKQEHLRHLRGIGEGSYGTVSEVEWLGQKVAAKIFKYVDSKSFRVEANILAGLRHPNIVQIFGISTGRGQSSISIVMELMYGSLRHALDAVKGYAPKGETLTSYSTEPSSPKGETFTSYSTEQSLEHGDLRQAIDAVKGETSTSYHREQSLEHGDIRHAIDALKGDTSTSYHREQSLELRFALDIMLQMAEAMQYLHRKKITHRDLKSLNMLINPAQIPEIAEAGYMDVKLADFGTSKIVTSTTTMSPQTTDIGSRLWMAPEVWYQPEKDSTKLKYYPLKSDVYSYAITCYEILSGRVPFEGLRISELLEKVMAGMRPSLPNSLPTSLSSLIECCWDGDVRRRPSFSTISTQLRHLKGIYLISGKCSCN
jgi:serine/threonine protein kinase